MEYMLLLLLLYIGSNAICGTARIESPVFGSGASELDLEARVS